MIIFDLMDEIRSKDFYHIRNLNLLDYTCMANHLKLGVYKIESFHAKKRKSSY